MKTILFLIVLLSCSCTLPTISTPWPVEDAEKLHEQNIRSIKSPYSAGYYEDEVR